MSSSRALVVYGISFSALAVVLSLVVVISGSDQTNVMKNLSWGEIQTTSYYCSDGYFCKNEKAMIYAGVLGVVTVIGESMLPDATYTTMWADCSGVCVDCQDSFKSAYPLAIAFFAITIASVVMGWVRTRTNGITYKLACVALTLTPVALGIASVVTFANKCMSEIAKGYDKTSYGPAFALLATALCLQFLSACCHGVAAEDVSISGPVGSAPPPVRSAPPPAVQMTPSLQYAPVPASGAPVYGQTNGQPYYGQPGVVPMAQSGGVSYAQVPSHASHHPGVVPVVTGIVTVAPENEKMAL